MELDDPDNGSFGIRAVAAGDAEIGSVRLELSGAKAVARTEGIASWSLYGDAERNLGGDVLQTLSVSFTVTASFEALPSEHDSESVFTFNVRFSEALASKRAAVRSAFTVTGESVTGQMRVNGQSDLWQIKIRPSSHGDVSIALPANVACNAGGYGGWGRALERAERDGPRTGGVRRWRMHGSMRRQTRRSTSS